MKKRYLVVIILLICGLLPFNLASAYSFTPSISYVTPTNGKTGDLVYILGSNFGDYSYSVNFGNKSAPIVSWSDTLIVAQVPWQAGSSLAVTRYTYTSNSVGFIYIPNMTYDVYEGKHLEQINIKKGWEAQPYGSPNVIVAILDQGVYENHPDLINNMWRNNSEVQNDGKDNDNNGYIDDYYGWNFIDNNSDMTTKGDHGTLVAGLIGATKDNGVGVAGIASGVKIMPVIVCGNDGGCSADNVQKGIKYATDNGADIINLSLSGSGTMGYQGSYDESVKYAAEKGVLIIAAAGNTEKEGEIGQNLNYIKSSPACNDLGYNYVLGVAALDNSNKKALFSSYGSNCVDISGPGVNIVSTSVPAYSNYSYDFQSGTSFAAPIIAGVAALIKSYHPHFNNWDIMNKLIYTATNIDSDNSGYQGQLGGLVNPYDAIMNDNIPAVLLSVSPQSAKSGEKIKLTVKNFLSDYNVSLTGPTTGLTISNSDITIKNGSEIELTVPSNTVNGLYSIAVMSKNNQQTLSELKNVLTIAQSSSAIVETPSTPAVTNTKNETNNTGYNNSSSPLVGRLKGYILLQVQEHGEAWYLDPTSLKRYYLKDGPVAYEALRKFGLGITNIDLAKIPVGVESRFTDVDSDGDGLSDKLEEGLATDPLKPDSDGDGVSDGNEVLKNNTNPIGAGKLTYSASLINQLKGKILLQVQSHGEAWYLNPKDGKRYYMKNGEAAYQIMRFLSLGITNADLDQISTGSL